MVVAGPEGFQKNQYRKFNIRSADLTPGDDFAMMREVLERRFKRLMTESPRQLPADVAGAAVAGGDGTFGNDSARRGLRHPLPSRERVARTEGPSRVRGSLRKLASHANPSPALAALGHPLPQGERVTEQAASGEDIESDEI